MDNFENFITEYEKDYQSNEHLFYCLLITILENVRYFITTET